MITVTGSAATIGNSWLADAVRASGSAVRADQFVTLPGAALLGAARSFQHAVRLRKEAMTRRLEDFVLELAAAIILIAIFAILMDPATRGDR